MHMSELSVRILLPNDKESILQFERTLLASQEADPMSAELASWTARWRPEALDHYLPQGWSFATFSRDELVGYILAQPFLFQRGHTQTLWVEHLAYTSQSAASLLVDTVHRWARDKHFQCVLIEHSEGTKFILSEGKPAQVAEAGLIELKSTRH